MTLTQVLRRAGVFFAAALLVTAVSIKPVTVFAMGTDSPPPSDDGKKKKKKKDQNVIEQQEQQLAQEKFLRGYRDARQLILDGQYEAGITAMHALGRDDHPDVANYIGYANRKMGNYDQSKIWYEAHSNPIQTTCAPGPITACGTWNRVTGSRRWTTCRRSS